ncbi:hypothetical protein CEXT_107241 [Caerostris extrusa]|uniref:Uncharacterized protein n=1 Tax=Caerostris extrusa TaxID=172846 RepID=A0AAV4TAN5_CAEEX|nr:hypothetical protein CEXT_107241 [Caerostris extrusa]
MRHLSKCLRNRLIEFLLTKRTLSNLIKREVICFLTEAITIPISLPMSPVPPCITWKRSSVGQGRVILGVVSFIVPVSSSGNVFLTSVSLSLQPVC